MKRAKVDSRRYAAIFMLLILLLGVVGFVSTIQSSIKKTSGPTIKITHMAHPPIDSVALMKMINPSGGYSLSIVYDQLGVQLTKAEIIDISRLRSSLKNSVHNLTQDELNILTQGSRDKITFTSENTYFLEKFFWAIGLANQNIILDQNEIKGKEASLPSITAWKLSNQSALTFFSQEKLLNLTSEQQALVEEIARITYLPCCDNPVFIPDCKHNMAMLGLLETTASQGLRKEAMLAAVKNAKAFWFPQQTLEQTIFHIATQLKDYSAIENLIFMSSDYSSKTGFQHLHQWLTQNGMSRDNNIAPIDCTES